MLIRLFDALFTDRNPITEYLSRQPASKPSSPLPKLPTDYSCEVLLEDADLLVGRLLADDSRGGGARSTLNTGGSSSPRRTR
jgi:hypothetical protein